MVIDGVWCISIHLASLRPLRYIPSECTSISSGEAYIRFCRMRPTGIVQKPHIPDIISDLINNHIILRFRCLF